MKLVSAEDLQGKELAAFELLSKHFPSGAVCVNVMCTAESWDVRPLLLISGTVFLYRISPALPFDFLKNVLAEMDGFTLLPNWNTSVKSLPASDRFLSIRPFVATTLAEVLTREDRLGLADPLTVARKLIEQVLELDRRHLVHGHICPSNVAFSQSGTGSLFLLDPRIGSFTGRKDEFCAPELEKLSDPPQSVDLYGLGVCLRAVLGDGAAPHHKEMIDRLVLASPRQRPNLAAVAALFLDNRAAANQPSASPDTTSRGRIIGGSTSSERAPAPSSPYSPDFFGAAQAEMTRAESAMDNGVAAVLRRRKPGLPSTKFVAGALMAAAGALALLHWRFPRTYNEIAYYFPILAAQSNPEFLAALASGDKARLRSVARSAVLERDPAAINAILEDVGSGATRPGFNASLVRCAYQSPWKEEFSKSDMQTLLALTAAPVFPEGLAGLPSINSLHPAIILAVASQLSPNAPGEQLKSVSLDKLALLGDPAGNAFEALRAKGVASMADPLAIALAQVVAGTANSAAYDALIGSSAEVTPTLEQIALLLPVVMSKPALADQLLGAIRDRGGDLGSVLGWFDIDDLVAWKEVPSAAKLLLLLEQVPSVGLSSSQYADLLKFPLPAVREHAAMQIKSRGLRQFDVQVLDLLTSDNNRLSRAQSVALLSGLLLEPAKRAPFVALWFQMEPPADTTLLVLLARSACDDKDLFNLEAARYLKKHPWRGTTEILKLLAQHPEPLARSLAYARLDPSVPEQKKVLQDRISTERDAALLKAVTAKLSP